MRVSTDPQDAAYDPRPRRVWCNDAEVTGWSVADEFRRVVIVDGKARFGSIRIERIESGEGGNPLEATPTAPVNTGFVGVMVHTPDPKPDAPAAPQEPSETKEPSPMVIPAASLPALPTWTHVPTQKQGKRR